MPSTPQKNSHWRSAEERAAEGGLPVRRRAQAGPMLLRFIRPPADAAEAAPPPPLLAAGEERRARPIEDWLLSTDGPSIHHTGPSGGGAGGTLPLQEGPQKRQRLQFPPTPPKARDQGAGSGVDRDYLPRGRGQPHSRDAADRKSGRGRTRRFLYPTIRSREKVRVGVVLWLMGVG